MQVAREAEEARQAQLAMEAVKVAPTAPTPVYSAPVSSSGDVQSIIIHWAGVYGVSADWLLRVANCESGFSTTVVNHGYSAGGGSPTGLFQFLPSTFAANGGTNIWDANDQARVAAHMFSIGQSGQWACN